MARKRTPPRKRRTTTAARAATPAPKAPAPPSDGRLTKSALRAHVRKSKGPIFNILKPFEAIKDELT